MPETGALIVAKASGRRKNAMQALFFYYKGSSCEFLSRRTFSIRLRFLPARSAVQKAGQPPPSCLYIIPQTSL